MYRSAFSIGLSADEFWNMTLRKYTYCRDGYLDRLSKDWDHTASLMSILVNINSPKGKRFEPKDFHPFEQMNNQGVSSKEEALALLEKLKDF